MTEERSVPDVQPLETWLLTAPEFEKCRGMVLYLMHRRARLSTSEYEPAVGTGRRAARTSWSRASRRGPWKHVPPRAPPRSTETADGRPTTGVEVIRYGQFGFPAQVSLQQPQALRIAVNRQPTPDATRQVALHLFVRQWPMKVVATLVNVRPRTPRRGPQHWRPRSTGGREHSEPLVFVLVPRSLGPKTIRIRFEQDNTFVTTARIPTEVLGPSSRGNRSRRGWSPRPPSSPEASRRTSRSTSSATRSGPTPSPCAGETVDPGTPAERVGELTFEQEGSPGLYVRTRFEELDATVTDEGATARYADAVERLGNNVYEKLFIRGGLDAFYWERMYPRSKQQGGGAPGREAPTVQIVSDEPYIPWELLRPYRDTLGESRWTRSSSASGSRSRGGWMCGTAPTRWSSSRSPSWWPFPT